MTNMKYRLLTWYVTLAVFLMPVVALAASKEDEETVLLEGRLEGYSSNVRLPSASTALTWLLIGFLGVIAISTLFKNAKRTHLD
jgi:hypothetical protein